jgi:hypothetical protein
MIPVLVKSVWLRNVCKFVTGATLLQLGFREDFLEINQSETRMACGGHVC